MPFYTLQQNAMADQRRAETAAVDRQHHSRHCTQRLRCGDDRCHLIPCGTSGMGCRLDRSYTVNERCMPALTRMSSGDHDQHRPQRSAFATTMAPRPARQRPAPTALAVGDNGTGVDDTRLPRVQLSTAIGSHRGRRRSPQRLASPEFAGGLVSRQGKVC
jgi:hypothetical protein